MEGEDKISAYEKTHFAKHAAIFNMKPELFDTKRKLRDFWQFAIAERSKNTYFQDFIATDAARCGNTVNYSNVEGDPYQDVILQFHRMDHMDIYYGRQADKEWEKVAQMVENLD